MLKTVFAAVAIFMALAIAPAQAGVVRGTAKRVVAPVARATGRTVKSAAKLAWKAVW